jgi:hypothetical protein
MSDETKGLPDMASEERDANEKKSRVVILVSMLLVSGIGIAIAFGIRGATDHAPKQAVVDVLRTYDLGYLYLSGFFFAKLIGFVNLYPTIYKSRVMRGKSGNLRANMMLYKSVANGGLVVLDTVGDAGKYNRANRSLAHLVENGLPTPLVIILAGPCFPVPTLVLTLIFCAGRVLHQIGYTLSGYGGHAIGFVLAMLSMAIFDGLLLVAAFVAFAAL